MSDETTEQQKTKTCLACGEAFVPKGDDDQCCSPFCRTMFIAKSREDKRVAEHEAKIKALAAMEKPPRFNLKEHPKSRVEWFMDLPPEFKMKFRRFLTQQENEWAHAMGQKILSDEKFFSGFFVKKGKIIEVRGGGDNESDGGRDQEQASGQPDENDEIE